MTLQERLDDAEAAYHELVSGKAPRVVVDQNGERVEYSPASAPRLAAYIAELKRELGQCGVKPMKVWL